MVATVDLGQGAEPTALAVLEVVPTPTTYVVAVPEPGAYPPREHEVIVDGPPARLQLRHLERWQGESYPAIAAAVGARLGALPGGAVLAVDATGVGQAVADLFSALWHPVITVTLTNGQAVRDGALWTVSKRDLAHGLLVALQQGRLVAAAALPLASTLVDELVGFSFRPRRVSGAESELVWREVPQDDLLLATAIGAWVAEQAVADAAQSALAEAYAAVFNEATRVAISPF